MNKALIFDWSGTLSDNFHCFCKVVDLMCEHFNQPNISEDEIRKTFTIPYMKFWKAHFPDLSLEEQKVLYEKFIHMAEHPSIHKGVVETLTKLREDGWKLFVISSDPLSKLYPEVDSSGLNSFFVQVIGEVHEKHEAIASLMNTYGLDCANTYYVGDTPGDISEGKYAEVKTIGISWGFVSKNRLAEAKPDLLVETIEEIHPFL